MVLVEGQHLSCHLVHLVGWCGVGGVDGGWGQAEAAARVVERNQGAQAQRWAQDGRAGRRHAAPWQAARHSRPHPRKVGGQAGQPGAQVELGDGARQAQRAQRHRVRRVQHVQRRAVRVRQDGPAAQSHGGTVLSSSSSSDARGPGSVCWALEAGRLQGGAISAARQPAYRPPSGSPGGLARLLAARQPRVLQQAGQRGVWREDQQRAVQRLLRQVKARAQVRVRVWA